MTKVAILADIHGNLPALEHVLADLARFPVDQVIVAGDVINWGPFSAAVTERAVAEGWAVTRGNNEFYLLDYETPRAPALWRDPVAFPLLPWLKRQLAGRLQRQIAAWPDTITFRPPDAPPLRVVHGSPRSPWEPIYPDTSAADVAAMLAGVAEGTIVAAHTHIPMDRRIGRWHLLNPGSVGVPILGEQIASYLLLEGDESGWHPTFRSVPLGAEVNEAVLREFARQGFAAECGIVGELVLEEFRTARIHLSRFLAWRAATCPDAPYTAATLARYRASGTEDYLPPAYRAPLAGAST